MGMGVEVRGRSMRRPARVCDAGLLGGVKIGFLLEHEDPSRRLGDRHARIADNRHTGRVVPPVLQTTKAPIYYVLNLMTKYAETHRFKARDFVIELEKVLARRLDGILYNTAVPGRGFQKAYAQQKAQLVRVDQADGWWEDRKLISADLLDTAGGVVRHDAFKLAAAIDALTDDLVAAKQARACGRSANQR